MPAPPKNASPHLTVDRAAALAQLGVCRTNGFYKIHMS